MATKKKAAKPKKAAAKAKKPAAAKKAPAVQKSPRPQSLPGMEDRRIAALEDKARDYADVRDSRIQLSKQEGELKKDLLNLMKKAKKDHYSSNGVLIDVVHEKENIKVKVKGSNEVDDSEPSNVPADDVAVTTTPAVSSGQDEDFPEGDVEEEEAEEEEEDEDLDYEEDDVEESASV